jgi:TRAP transporter TAXI family solute receptor
VGDKAYQAAVIPANTYEGQTADVPTAAINNYLVTREGVPDEVVYQMVKSMYANLPALSAAHAAGKAIRLNNALRGMPLPLHPGAEKYYKEVGLLK